MKKLLNVFTVLVFALNLTVLFGENIPMKNRIYGFNKVNYYDSFDYFDKTNPWPVEVVTTDIASFYIFGSVFTNERQLVAIGMIQAGPFHVINIDHQSGITSEGAEMTSLEDLVPNTADQYIYWSGLACDRNSNKVYITARKWNGYTGSLLGTVNLSEGKVMLITETEVTAIQDIAIDNDGNLFAVTSQYTDENTGEIIPGKFYSINKETGEFTLLGVPDQVMKGSIGMTCDENTNKIYVSFTPIYTGDGYIGELNKETGSIENVIYQDFYHCYSPIAMMPKESGIANDEKTIENFALLQNYPNPFNPTTKISFVLNKAANVKLSVFNSKGEAVSNLLSSNLTVGQHSVAFDATNLNSGIYFYSLTVNGITESKKMILTK